MTGSVIVAHQEGSDGLAAQFFLLTVGEFAAMEEDRRRALAILTPRKDHTGQHVDVDPHYEIQLFRIPPGSNDQSSLMEDVEGGIVPLADLMQNPVHALILLESPFNVLGLASPLSADEQKLLESYAIHGTEEQIRKTIEQDIRRTMEIRRQHKLKGSSEGTEVTARQPKTVKKWWQPWK